MAKFPRRQFLQLAAGAVALPAAFRMALAEIYPSRPVRIVVGFVPGGAVDILARLTGQWLSARLGQPFVVENRPGAGGNIATEMVLRSPSDGYTLLMTGVNNAINATLYETRSFNFVRDVAPIASIISQPNIVVVNPSVPANTIAEFIAYAKANPGKINMASAGNGTGPHLAGELFKMMAGVDLMHVPYRGAVPAITDLIAGRAQVMFLPPVATIRYIRAGQLRALAVTSIARWEGLPDLPTVGEYVPGYESDSNWFGIVAPKNTPGAIVDKLNKDINAGLADPKLRAQLADLGGGVLVSTPADFARLISADSEKWAKVIRFAGIKPK